MPVEPPVLVRQQDDVTVLTLNRPRVLNAVDAALSDALGDALQQFQADAVQRVAVLTGAGRAFCAGADLTALAAGRPVYPVKNPQWGFGGVTEHQLDKPLIAAVNGPALGGGLEIVLACDLVVLSDQAVLGLPEVTRGLLAAAGGLLHLARRLPPAVAAEKALTGEPLTPAEALRHGLVNRVVPPEDVLRVAMELAGRIAANAPLSVTASKRLMRAALGEGAPWDRELWSQQCREQAAVVSSRDALEGATAFTQGRPPRWSGA